MVYNNAGVSILASEYFWQSMPDLTHRVEEKRGEKSRGNTHKTTTVTLVVHACQGIEYAEKVIYVLHTNLSWFKVFTSDSMLLSVEHGILLGHLTVRLQLELCG